MNTVATLKLSASDQTGRLENITLEELSRRLAQDISREKTRKERILARSPGVFSSMDAEEREQTSAAVLATRELKELGITPRNSDPIELIDAHHAGRQWAREQMLGRSLGKGGANTSLLIGEARDSAIKTILDKYLEE
jgi:hypothetical protein